MKHLKMLVTPEQLAQLIGLPKDVCIQQVRQWDTDCVPPEAITLWLEGEGLPDMCQTEKGAPIMTLRPGFATRLCFESWDYYGQEKP